ncbi:hypothetical protein NQ318_010298 [Aromia moschata]|uniref:Cuticle protein n=1 Tax=Aromia moschata TaxID=1265417 RepID=A0AAV8XSA4_9CUCU|nr:hypothetical protein NQ318_010298 [Aromia moschata]
MFSTELVDESNAYFWNFNPRFTGPIARYGTPLITPAHVPGTKAIVSQDYDPNPQYTYSYYVQDPLTGDFKNQIESRNGDLVQGSYSLIEPDGSRRTVEYNADSVNGFNAVVHKEPLAAATPTLAALPTYAQLPTSAITKLASPAYGHIRTPLIYPSIAPSPFGLSKTIIH